MKNRHDPSQKPYYRCLSCQNFRNTCVGLPTRDMTLEQWCEYVRDVMEKAHLTNAYVAEKAEVSVRTIERIKAVNIEQDIMRANARRIELVVFGPVSRHYCDIDCDNSETTELINQLKEEIRYWKKENELKAKIIEKYIQL